MQLLEQVYKMVPEGADVIFLGDGEFDGITLQASIDAHGWEYVYHTAKNTQLGAEGERFSFHEIGVQPGECIGLPNVTFTLQEYGPVLAIAWWEARYEEPIYLGFVQQMDENVRYAKPGGCVSPCRSTVLFQMSPVHTPGRISILLSQIRPSYHGFPQS